jgi:hypothetical protein
MALAERGATPGEKSAAAGRLARLKAAYDFAQPDPEDKQDLFCGEFRRASSSAFICNFAPDEIELSSFVKWCLEAGTKIPCEFKGHALHALAGGSTADKLAEIALHLADGFRTLTAQFCEKQPEDRSLFGRGLLDGILNEERAQGEPLPARRVPQTNGRGHKRLAVASPAKLNVHPYSLGIGLGKQLRFSASIAKVSAELAEQLNPKQIAA